MDFQELLSQADYNKSEAQYTARVQKYSAELPPPKKVPKANVQSENVKRFLEKKKAEEEAKLAEARKQKERLLELRSQNSKNNKKAKIMASRTKDNDFSKIKLTEDEIEARNKREAEIRKTLVDKVERMKMRIEMEEKEKLLPRKRKRKSKNTEAVDVAENILEAATNESKESSSNIRDKNQSHSQKDKIQKPKPAPPAMSFSELLKMAQKKQFEPVKVVVAKKEEEKLMTKKEKREYEEELARQRRKQERLQRGESGLGPKSNSVQPSSVNKKDLSDKAGNKKPVVIHVAKDVSKPGSDSSQLKIPKSSVNVSNNKAVPVKHKDITSNVNGKISNSIGKSEKSPVVNGQKKIRLKEERETEVRQKVSMSKKNGLKTQSDEAASSKAPILDEAALKETIEKQIREKIEKEMEEKIAAKFAQLAAQHAKVVEKPPETPPPVKKVSETSSSVPKKKAVEKPKISREEFEQFIAMKKRQAMQKQKELKPKLPSKKPFHINPYLDPPRRLLEPQRPSRPPVRRRIESDDDDDDDDDMNDFIVDSSQNEENYSKYIQEIFGYDRNKYLDDDEDEIMESSFGEQLKEETRSARLGYLEDLEEERLEKMRMKKKKLK